MDVKITEQMKVNNRDFSASQMEVGHNAGPITWQNAKDSEFQYVTKENREHFLDYFLSFGAWEKEELEEEGTLNGLAVQEIASRIREMEGLTAEEYEEQSEQGNIQGGIYQHEDDHYIYIGV